MSEALVSLFIVGAAKAGTTSLQEYLSAHPGVFMCSPKEPNFFSAPDLYSHGTYYKERVIDSERDYRALFAAAPAGVLLGEASVSYLGFECVAGRIARYNPQARIVALLRDPVTRAWSHYLMDRRLGYCDVDLRDVWEQPDSFPLHFRQYFEYGLYGQHLQLYREHFPREQLLVLFSRDLERDRDSTLAKVSQFLGLEDLPLEGLSREHNVYKRPRGALLSRLYASATLREFARRAMPAYLTRKLEPLVFSQGRKPLLEPAMTAVLQDFYRDDAQVLARLLGLPGNPWDWTL